MNVEPETARAKVEHGGKSYYFCSVRCGKRFEKEPEKFLAAPGTGGMEQAHARRAFALPQRPPADTQNIRYTCPMHPEICADRSWGVARFAGWLWSRWILLLGSRRTLSTTPMRKRLWISAAFVAACVGDFDGPGTRLEFVSIPA